MAKVGTERIFHKGSGKEIFSEIKFYTKTKLFIATGMPEEVTKYYGNKRDRLETYRSYHHSGQISANSYDECVKLAREIYTEFYDQQITETKIIAYKLKSNGNGKSDLFHAPSLALGIEYRIMYRIMIGEEAFISTGPYEKSKNPDEGHRQGGHRLEQEQGSLGLYDWEKIIYTTEAHDFFKKVETGLIIMIEKVTDFFGKDANHFLENLNSGKLIN